MPVTFTASLKVAARCTVPELRLPLPPVIPVPLVAIDDNVAAVVSMASVPSGPVGAPARLRLLPA